MRSCTAKRVMSLALSAASGVARASVATGERNRVQVTLTQKMPAEGAGDVRRQDTSLWLLFAPVFAAVYLLHLTLMRLPYFWDEGGYYIPCAWDFFRFGTLIPVSTMRNAHPPLPSILLAGWWKLTGFNIYSTRLFLCVVTTVALLAVFRMARGLIGQRAAFAVMALTAVYPVWFAQSTLAHADMFAAAATLWALVFYLEARSTGPRPEYRRQAWAMAACFTLAVLSKETAIVTPAALFCLETVLWLRQHGKAVLQKSSSAGLGMLAALAFPALPLAAWFSYHKLRTGFMFGNPEYLRYNATANLSAARVLLSMWHRLIHLTVHMNLFVPVLLTIAALLRPARAGEPRLSRRVFLTLGVVVAANWMAFSILGGALLTRYLLPAFPLILLVCVSSWQRRVRLWPALASLSLAAFAVGCEVNPPYPFAPEDNLAYRDMIVLHQQAIAQLQQRFPGATVLSAWPVTADLQRPELGYVAAPVRTAEIQNFTAAEIAKAAERSGDYDTAVVFSTKYTPPAGGLNLAGTPSRADATYFDAHRDLLPDEIARALGGRVVWQTERKGQWTGLLHFERSYEARLAAHTRP